MAKKHTHFFRIHPSYNIFVIHYLTENSHYYSEYDVGPLESMLAPLDNSGSLPAIMFHLYGKKWVTLPLLYDLAKEINTRLPSNQFDWHQTFYRLELLYYVDQLTRQRRPNPTGRDSDGDIIPYNFADLTVNMKLMDEMKEDPIVQEKTNSEVQYQLKIQKID